LRIIKKKSGKKFKLASFTSLATRQEPQPPARTLPGRQAPWQPEQQPQVRRQAAQPEPARPELPKGSRQRLARQPGLAP
jgi:hypothetical protein